MVTLTPPVSTPTLVGQLRSCTFIWYQEIPSVGGVQRNQNFDPLAPGLIRSSFKWTEPLFFSYHVLRHTHRQTHIDRHTDGHEYSICSCGG